MAIKKMHMYLAKYAAKIVHKINTRISKVIMKIN